MAVSPAPMTATRSPIGIGRSSRTLRRKVIPETTSSLSSPSNPSCFANCAPTAMNTASYPSLRRLLNVKSTPAVWLYWMSTPSPSRTAISWAI